MGKKLVIIFSSLLLIVLFLAVGYMAGILNARQTDNIELSRKIFKKAQFEYKSADYLSTIKYLEVANDIYKNYDYSIASVKKMKNLNNLIEKNPNDYKLLIERADVQNVQPAILYENGAITSNYCEAIKDYSKALTINSALNEIYHKRAKAYIGCKKGVDYKNNIVKDYEKAISLTSDKDELIEEVADWFLYEVDDVPSALRYYNKIQEYSINKEEINKNKTSFDVKNINYVPFKKVVCYDEIKDYDAIFNLLDEIIDETDNDEIFQKANNLKFYYYIKNHNYTAAIHNTKDCSAMICKVITFLNFKERNGA